MRMGSAIGIAVLVLASTAWADEIDKAKLQGTLRLPGIKMMLDWDYDGVPRSASKAHPRKRIVEIRQSLKGDPSDAEQFSELGFLHDQLGEEKASQEAYARAVELYRKQVEVEPKQARSLVGLGLALRGVGQSEQAEIVLRRSAKGSDDWKAWAALGDFYHHRAIDELFGGPDKCLRNLQSGELYARAQNGQFPSAAAANAEPFLTDAVTCYDKAVELAPQQPDPLVARASFRFVARELRVSMEHARGHKVDPPGTIPTDCLEDLRSAVSLGVTDPHLLVQAAFYEALAGLPEDWEPGSGSDSMWRSLGEKSKDVIEKTLDRLQKLAEDQDRDKAREALFELATAQFGLVGDVEVAARNVRKILEFDPKDEAAWELLIVIVVGDKKGDAKGLEVCQERVKQCDTVQGQLILAKAYARLEQFDPAEVHYRRAVNMEPDNFLANLSLATILLKRASNREVPKEALEQLQRAEKLVTDKTPSEEKQHLTAVVGAAKAIAGDVEEAQCILESLLAQNPEQAIAQDALEILRK
jgi:tetratricopeptide (TPR) repeat protein